MHGTPRVRPVTRPATSGMNAVVWIGRDRALVVRDHLDGAPTTTEVAIPAVPAITPPVLAGLAHTIGDADRILVLGADDLRTALEREIVAIGHHPETIRESELEGPVGPEVLLERLRRLA
jgi:hypothetical protein